MGYQLSRMRLYKEGYRLKLKDQKVKPLKTVVKVNVL